MKIWSHIFMLHVNYSQKFTARKNQDKHRLIKEGARTEIGTTVFP